MGTNITNIGCHETSIVFDAIEDLNEVEWLVVINGVTATINKMDVRVYPKASKMYASYDLLRQKGLI